MAKNVADILAIENDTKTEILKLLNIQKFPNELNQFAEEIDNDFQKQGLTIVVAKAYCLGVINGKRAERKKK